MKEPRVKRGIVAVTVLLLVMALASLASSSAWATPSQDVLRQTVPTPGPPEETPVPPPQSIVLPPQRSGDDYSFVYVPLPPVDYPPPAGCGIYNPFQIEAYLGTELMFPEEFDPPLQVCVSYSTEQAAEVGGADNLGVVYWDMITQQWIPLDNWRQDANLSQVCGDISSLPADNVFAITCILSPTAVPVTGHGSDVANVYAVVALTITLLGTALLATRMRRQASAA